MKTLENVTDNEIENYILKVFNYYNGKINLFNNNAKIDINWANMNGHNAGGYSVFPNVIQIFPRVIKRYAVSIADLKINIVEIIIHELFHTDQIIDYSLYNYDDQYTSYIEHACQLQTSLYILSNANAINNLFGTDIILDKSHQEKIINYWYYPGIYYNRRKYVDHICMLIYFLSSGPNCDKKLIYDVVSSSILDNNTKVLININDNIITIKDDHGLIDINKFNNFAQKFICTASYSIDLSIDVIDNGNNNLCCYIKISFDNKNIMCEVRH